MATAKVQGMEFPVKAVSDLGDNYAVEIDLRNVRKGTRDKPSVLLVKINAKNREAAIKTALDVLKAKGDIDDYNL